MKRKQIKENKMKCKEGHECAKAPFSRGGFYCEICHPSYHEYSQKMKADRIAKMQMGKKNARAVNIMNSIFEND